jgi:hypothetical protein
MNMATAGRKSKYHDKVEPRLKEVREWRLEGKTEIQIAALLGIGYRTLMDYKAKYSQFSTVLKEATQLLVEDLEKSLFEIAKGGIKTKSTKKIYMHKNGDMILDRVEETENVSLPNIAALVFALKNLSGEKWMDKREYITNDTTFKDNLATLKKTIDEIEVKDGDVKLEDESHEV